MRRHLVLPLALLMLAAWAPPAGAHHWEDGPPLEQFETKAHWLEALHADYSHTPQFLPPPIPVVAKYAPEPGWRPLALYQQQPVRRSCDVPLSVVLAAEDATPRRVAVIQEAIRQTVVASRLPIVYGGAVPGPGDGERRLDPGVLWVVWRDTPFVRGAVEVPASGPLFQNTGFMVLDEGTFPREGSADGFASLLSGDRAVALHEFGHVAGLGHLPIDEYQHGSLMLAPDREMAFGAGDLRGLAALGCP